MTQDPRTLGARSEASSSSPSPPPPPPEPTARDMSQAESPEPAGGGIATSSPPPESYKLKFCTVCASNQNRSMEAHLRLATADSLYPVISFGTGSLVRLPGPSITQPNVYNFNSTSYAQMYSELLEKDERLYRSNGLLNMLDRNKNLKLAPERFQDWIPGMPRVDHVARGDKGALGTEGGAVDVIITCEERCWDAVLDDLMNKGSNLNRPVHVINIDIKDNHEEALVGGKAILDLADRLNEAAAQARATNGEDGWKNGEGSARKSFDERVPDVLAIWQEKWPSLPALWSLTWL